MSKKPKRSGHYCWVCGRHRPNEKFSGKGHKAHICKECARIPVEERNRIEHTREIERYWEQKNISKKNLARLTTLSKSSTAEVAELAQVVLEVARIYPFRKRRISRIAKERNDLIHKLEKVGLVIGWVYYDDEFSFEEERQLYDGEIEEEGYPHEVDDPQNYDYYLLNGKNENA